MTHRWKSNWIRSLVCVLVFAVFLAACGGEQAATTPAPSATDEAVPTADNTATSTPLPSPEPTSTPTVEVGMTSEPTPSPQTEQTQGVFFQDDFTDPASNWPAFKDSRGFYGYHPPDYYHVEASLPNDRAMVFYGPSFDDVTVETQVFVDHTDTQEGDFRYGLGLRQTADGFYAFLISPRAETWQVLKVTPSGTETLAEGEITTLQGLTALDTLRVDAFGPNFIFSVNGQVLTQVNDPDFPSGNVGFFVETFDETLAHIHYDSLVVRAVEIDAAMMAQVPTPTPAPVTADQPALPSPERMVRIPAGMYKVGLDAPGGNYIPAQDVELDKFWIDAYEVTNAQYAAYLAEVEQAVPAGWTESQIPAGQEAHPVEGVRWDEAAAYCGWANKRLPTEAEWEAAARGEASLLYPWGNNAQAVDLPRDGTYPVGSVSGNVSSFGVYDMAGNVWEWVDEPYSPVPEGMRVLHGGAHGFLKDMAYRLLGDPNIATMYATAGFRCAADQVSEEPVAEAATNLYDDFTDPNSGWPALQESDRFFGYHPPDYYHVEASKAGEVVTVFKGPTLGDVMVETAVLVDHTDTQDGDFRYGLALHQSGEGYYAFVIDPRADTWQVLKNTPGGLETLAEGATQTLQGLSALDTLRVEARGTDFVFSINGEIVNEMHDGDYSSGNAGFFVQTFDESLAHIHYDSLNIEPAVTGEVPAPSEPAGAVQVYDDFTDPNSGWPALQLEQSFYGYHPPDYYHVEVNSPNYRVVSFKVPPFSDVTVETEALVDHTNTQEGNFRYGLALRHTGAKYYAFAISPRAGTWQVLKSAPGSLETLDEGTITTLKGLSALDTLRVDAVGSHFVFAINGEVVSEVDDATYPSGNVGFFVETFDETLAHIHYDSLTITEVESAGGMASTPWQAAYFANETLSGTPALTREDEALDFDWTDGAPDATLPADHFSVRWQGAPAFEAGRYLFTTTTDDGVRLFIDGEPVIDSWQPMRGSRSALVELSKGTHEVVVEYFEQEGAAMAKLDWALIDRAGSSN